MGINSTAELDPIEKEITIKQSEILTQQNNTKFKITDILNLTNIGNNENLLNKNNTSITIDLDGVEIESFIKSMFLYQQESYKIINIVLTSNGEEIGQINIDLDSKIDLILRDIKRLKIGSIKSFPKKSKEKLSVYDLEKDRENFFQHIVSIINNKYSNIFSKQNISLTNNKLFYKEIYENENSAEFCITMTLLLELVMKNIHKTNKKTNANEIFDEVLNTVSINSGLDLNGEIIKKSFSLIKRFWSYSHHFRDKLTFN